MQSLLVVSLSFVVSSVQTHIHVLTAPAQCAVRLLMTPWDHPDFEVILVESLLSQMLQTNAAEAIDDVTFASPAGSGCVTVCRRPSFYVLLFASMLELQNSLKPVLLSVISKLISSKPEDLVSNLQIDSSAEALAEFLGLFVSQVAENDFNGLFRAAVIDDAGLVFGIIHFAMLKICGVIG